MKVVIGYDGSDGARKALERAAELAGPRTPMTVVSVARPTSGAVRGSMAAIPGPEVEKRRDDLDEARRLLADREIRSVEGRGDPARVIVEIAEEIGADLIAVGTRSQGRFGRALRGSVSSDVVHRARRSVLVVR